MKLASFDLEIADEYTEGNYYVPISCAAIAQEGDISSPFIRRWHQFPSMDEIMARKVVDDLSEISHNFRIVTWNGCAFDFQVLANACNDSSYVLKCGQLAFNHVDMMLIVTFLRGHFLGLEKALIGQGLKGKTHHVRLKDGTTIEDMSGGKAPALWKVGETDAVMEYLDGDVLQTLSLAQNIFDTGSIFWTSNSGKPNRIHFSGFPTVAECFKFPKPDTSWMKDAPTREHFVEWIPDWHLFI